MSGAAPSSPTALSYSRSATLAFVDGNHAAFSYSINGRPERGNTERWMPGWPHRSFIPAMPCGVAGTFFAPAAAPQRDAECDAVDCPMIDAVAINSSNSAIDALPETP